MKYRRIVARSLCSGTTSWKYTTSPDKVTFKTDTKLSYSLDATAFELGELYVDAIAFELGELYAGPAWQPEEIQSFFLFKQ